MSDAFVWVGIVLGLVLCVFLLRFITRSWSQLKAFEAAKAEQEAQLAEKRENAVNSIKVIAQCMLDEQVESSEACIRIKVLLDHVAPELHKDERFAIFEKMYQGLEHMPTHEARKNTDKRVIFKLDQERFALEEEHKDAVISASKAILQYSF